ncbi:hypothetical protein [Flagellimonas aequoris]|uniref:hypothetical protein n=1 Tax=Flagellimonas aequoris TaxID=2306997 RepID=UPI001602EC96|nr:hypothetical protein [Allomuricauda aequoris]
MNLPMSQKGYDYNQLDAISYDVHHAEVGLEWHPFPCFEFLTEYTYSDRRYDDFTEI